MHHPETATACIDEEASLLLADGCLSGRELSQEIALLEAHLSESETDVSSYESMRKSLCYSMRFLDLLCDELGLGSSRFVNFAFLPDFDRAKLLSQGSRLTAWLIMRTIKRVQAQAARGTLIRLKFLSELTSLSAPLPAYGAELSQYRHRFR